MYHKFLLTITALTLAACVPAITNSTNSQPPAAVNTNTPDAMMKKPEADGAMMPKPIASSYVPFTQAAYDAAKAAKRPLFLFFYANWCPTCARQEPIMADLFGSGEAADYGVAAFRVNFNDPETDAAERALAEQFGVSYQHTFISLDASGTVVAKVNGHQTKEQLKAALEKISAQQ